MKTYLKHRIQNVIDIKSLIAMEYLDFEGKYKNYVEKHNFWEICYVEKGEISLCLEEEEKNLCEGDIILVSPDKTHSYFSKRGNENKAFVICFECFSQPLKSLDGVKFSLDEIYRAALRQIICEYKNTFYMSENDSLEVLSVPNFGGQQAIILQTEYLLICLIRMLSTDKNPEIVFLNEERFYQDLTDVIIDYFNENIRGSISLDEICNKVNYSKSFLCKTFKQQTGETLLGYFNRLKIEEAKRLLQKTELPVIEIAQHLGFSEAKYFGAMFKRITGASPTLFREKERGKRYDKTCGKIMELGTP